MAGWVAMQEAANVATSAGGGWAPPNAAGSSIIAPPPPQGSAGVAGLALLSHDAAAAAHLTGLEGTAACGCGEAAAVEDDTLPAGVVMEGPEFRARVLNADGSINAGGCQGLRWCLGCCRRAEQGGTGRRHGSAARSKRPGTPRCVLLPPLPPRRVPGAVAAAAGAGALLPRRQIHHCNRCVGCARRGGSAEGVADRPPPPPSTSVHRPACALHLPRLVRPQPPAPRLAARPCLMLWGSCRRAQLDQGWCSTGDGRRHQQATHPAILRRHTRA